MPTADQRSVIFVTKLTPTTKEQFPQTLNGIPVRIEQGWGGATHRSGNAITDGAPEPSSSVPLEDLLILKTRAISPRIRTASVVEDTMTVTVRVAFWPASMD